MIRRKMFLHNKIDKKAVALDVSAKSFKHKYLIEMGFTFFDYKFYDQFIKGSEKQLLSTIKTMSID
jgi:hypothetical protein